MKTILILVAICAVGLCANLPETVENDNVRSTVEVIISQQEVPTYLGLLAKATLELVYITYDNNVARAENLSTEFKRVAELGTPKVTGCEWQVIIGADNVFIAPKATQKFVVLNTNSTTQYANYNYQFVVFATNVAGATCNILL